MNTGWRDLHGQVIDSFLKHLNTKSNSFILKGGTALAKCYNLNRFSEDIDLDARKENIIHHVQSFCKQNNYSVRVAKDTAIVKRCLVNYGNYEKPLKIEVSYRNQNISADTIKNINGIQVYSIDKLAQMKCNAYNARDKIRDLFDLAFITNNYYNDLSEATISVISDALQYKGLEQVDYILATQHDELIAPDQLVTSFLEMHERLGLLLDEHENELVENSVVVSPDELAEEIHVQENGVEIADRIKSIGQKILADELSRKTNQNKVR